MQFSTTISIDELKKSSDPLVCTCHPLGKLKFISDVIWNLDISKNSEPFAGFKKESIYAIQEIIEDAVEEIELLIQISNDQFIAVLEELKELKAAQA